MLTFAELRREAAAGRGRASAPAVPARGAAGMPLTEGLGGERAARARGRVGFASMPYFPSELGASRAPASGRGPPCPAGVGAPRQHDRIVVASRAISDMSFLGQVDAAVPVIAANTPAWDHGIDWPEGRQAGCQVNTGPWGRDYHTPLERVHAR